MSRCFPDIISQKVILLFPEEIDFFSFPIGEIGNFSNIFFCVIIITIISDETRCLIFL